MKKYLSLLICIITTLILLSGCIDYNNNNSAKRTENPAAQSDEKTDWELTKYDTLNNFTNVNMFVNEGTVSSTGLSVVFENKSVKQCIFGEFFFLEKKINEKWYQVPINIDGNYSFKDIGYDLPSGHEREWTVDWDWLYGSLDSGQYRIVKDILDFRKSGDFDKYHLAAEFIIN